MYTGQRDIKDHPFFRKIDWDKLNAKQVKPPIIPKAGLNFDADFTNMDAEITPISSYTLVDVDQDLFKGFDYEVSLSDA